MPRMRNQAFRYAFSISVFAIVCESASHTTERRSNTPGIKLDAFGQAFDDRETLVIHGALDHRDHLIDLRSVRACDERAPFMARVGCRMQRSVPPLIEPDLAAGC